MLCATISESHSYNGASDRRAAAFHVCIMENELRYNFETILKKTAPKGRFFVGCLPNQA
jgi:hypothetical protein